MIQDKIKLDCGCEVEKVMSIYAPDGIKCPCGKNWAIAPSPIILC